MAEDGGGCGGGGCGGSGCGGGSCGGGDCGGVVSCRPPYDRHSCYSTNETVLGRVQNILSSFEVS